MYNHFLDTFIRAAELGSFSKTAEEMFITPSAVIQQINSLETDLGVKVFNRSKRGVTLTPAGEYLLIEGRAFVQRNHDIRLHLQAINAQMHGQVLVGCNPYHMPQMLYEIWPSFYLKNPECFLSSYTFNEMGTDVRPETDLIEGLQFIEPAWQKIFTFQKVKDIPFRLMVPQDHPLAKHRILTWTDIIDTTLVNVKNGVSQSNDMINAELKERGIHHYLVDVYSTSNIIQCMARGYAVVMPECWGNLHPGNKMVDFTWKYTIPYGFFISDHASSSAKQFLEHICT